jgi:hypothetical protein
MKYRRGALILGLIILFVCIVGCTTNQQTSQTPLPTSIVSTTTGSTTTISTPVPTTITPLPTTNPPITSDDIKQHFMDIAFGPGDNTLYRLPDQFSYSVGVYPPITRISFEKAPDSQIQALQKFVSDFNKYPQNLKLRENRFDTPGDIHLYIAYPSDFKNIVTSPPIIQHNGIIYAKSYPDQINFIRGGEITVTYTNKGSTFNGPSDIVINPAITGDELNYTIVRGLLYKLGFHGETLKYKDSIFFADNTNNSELSYIDKKAIEIMYGPSFHPGMTQGEVRSILSPNILNPK